MHVEEALNKKVRFDDFGIQLLATTEISTCQKVVAHRHMHATLRPHFVALLLWTRDAQLNFVLALFPGHS